MVLFTPCFTFSGLTLLFNITITTMFYVSSEINEVDSRQKILFFTGFLDI